MKTGKQRNSKVDYYPIKNDKDLHKLIHELLFELLDTYNKKHSKLYHENKAGTGDAQETGKVQQREWCRINIFAVPKKPQPAYALQLCPFNR